MHIYIVFCNVHIMKGVLKMKKSLKKNNNGCADICYDVCNDRACLRKRGI